MTNGLSTLREKYEKPQKLTKENIHKFMLSDLKEALIKAFCAFGKSHIEVWTMLEYTKKTSLLLLSSLNLLDQFRREYFDNKIDEDEYEVFFVCSDRNATTNKKEIKDFLNNNSGKKKLIVCLYQSFHVLTNVIKKTIGISDIDFLIADESHNLHQNGGDGTFEEKVGHEIDHIIPIQEGGTDEIENGQALCVSCHRVKTKYERQKHTN